MASTNGHKAHSNRSASASGNSRNREHDDRGPAGNNGNGTVGQRGTSSTNDRSSVVSPHLMGPVPGRPLRIAMVMPPWYELPPAGYGGMERVCSSLIDGLVDLGHHVTLFGTGTRTGTKARFVSTDPKLQYPRLLEAMPELVHVTRVNEILERERFDIVHDHTT